MLVLLTTGIYMDGVKGSLGVVRPAAARALPEAGQVRVLVGAEVVVAAEPVVR